MRRAWHRAQCAIAKVPGILIDFARRLIGELDRERDATAGGVGCKASVGRGYLRALDSDLACRCRSTAGTRDSQDDIVGSGFLECMDRVLLIAGCAVTKAPGVGCDCVNGLVGEANRERRSASGSINPECCNRRTWTLDVDLAGKVGCTARPGHL